MLNQSISFTLEGNDVGLAHTVLFLTSSETIHSLSLSLSLSLSSLFVCLFVCVESLEALVDGVVRTRDMF